LPGDVDETPPVAVRKPSRARSQAAKRAARTRAENTRLSAMWKHERELWRAGYEIIAGVDESGVGPLAGPVVAAAVILPRDFKAPGLWECKRLLAGKRPYFWGIIVNAATAVSVGIVDVEELDRINIHQAALKAMRLALAGLPTAPDAALVDAFAIPGLGIFHRPIVDGDAYSMSIAAASVVAKVTRDRIMERLDRLHPGYGFANHKGYGTREHREAIGRLGICPVHRRSFAPVTRFLETGSTEFCEAAEYDEDAPPEVAGRVEPETADLVPDGRG
jgi:ribonuclease HII